MRKTTFQNETRKAVAYESGRVSFQFWYSTTFGPNSAGYEKRYPTENDAIKAASEWVTQSPE